MANSGKTVSCSRCGLSKGYTVVGRHLVFCKKIPPPDKLESEFEQCKWSYRALAKKYGVSESAVYNHLQSFGIRRPNEIYCNKCESYTRKPSSHKRGMCSKLPDDWKSYLTKEYTLSDLAKMWGVTTSGLGSFLIRHGLRERIARVRDKKKSKPKPGTSKPIKSNHYCSRCFILIEVNKNLCDVCSGEKPHHYGGSCYTTVEKT